MRLVFSIVFFAFPLFANSATLISDTFTDAAGTELVAHTPDTDTVGGGWSALFGCATNECEIDGTGTALKVSGAFNHMGLDSGQSDVSVCLDWTSADRGIGVVIRNDGNNIVNAGDGYAFFIDDTLANELVLERYDNGAEVAIDSANFDGIAPPVTICLVGNGTSISGTIDDVEYVSAVSATYQTNTWVGIYEDAGTGVELADNFTVTTLDATAPVYSVSPACSQVSQDTASCTATATDDSPPIDHYMAVYADGYNSGSGTGGRS